MNSAFPFPAITGQDDAKKALLCALTSDEIRTVLIMGDRGTAKSTLARSIGMLANGKRVMTVPQNITYDRLVGSTDIETAVSSGKICLTPGLMEQGNRQILYADDINLMEEGVVRDLLSTAETGRFSLEREGMSCSIETRFLLVATMDPQEGELTPGQMDRFDLSVRLNPIAEEEMRAEIVKRNLQFERSPEEFSRKYWPATGDLKKKLEGARDRLPYVSIPKGHANLISSLCLELGIAGQRGDLAVARTAKALAALDGRDEVVFDDIRLASLLALEHRRREIPDTPPPPRPPQDRKDTDKDQNRESESPDPENSPDRSPPQQQDPDDRPQQNPPSPPPPAAEQVFDIGSTFEVIRYLDEKSKKETRKQKSGRRTRVMSADLSGHYRSFRLPDKNRNDIAVDATLRAAAPYQRMREHNGLAISVKKPDLREKVREKKIANTLLFLVDASGSMGVRRRMVAVKGAILSLLIDAYQKRDRVGLMIFRGTGAHLLLPPTRSPDLAARMLRTIPTGGMTPLTTGISEAHELLTRGRYAGAGENKSVVILTDGRVNVPVKDGSPPAELADLARNLAGCGIRFVVVDTESGFPRLGRARVLAGNLEATYFRLEDLGSRGLAAAVENTTYIQG
ncbi:MAG: VWA domain-containing protein [Methanoregula sp.]|nr:VWA domain-containing protein [Methanoregula sp.]